MNPTIVDVVRAIAPTTAVQTDGKKITAWDIAEEPTGVPQPTQAEVDAKLSELQAEHTAQQYARDRQYPPIGDQLDMIFHAGLGGDEFQAAIAAVKAAHPKP